MTQRRIVGCSWLDTREPVWPQRGFRFALGHGRNYTQVGFRVMRRAQ